MFYKNKNQSPSQDEEYQLFLKDEKIRLTKLLSVLGFVMYGAFIVVDYWALPSAFTTSIIIRLVALSLMALGYFLTYHSKFIRYYSQILSMNFLSAVIGVESMIYLAIPSDHAYTSYFAGLMIVLIALYSWTYLKLSITSSISVFAVVVYLGIEFYIKDTDAVAEDRTATVVTNIFFLGSAVIFGFLAQVQRDKYLRQNFLLQQSLKQAYNAKSVEAKDNEYLANHDSLTDLPNRRYMTELLNESLLVAKDKDKVLIIMFLDLNGFKQVNDIYGHAVGDEVLIIVAKRLELAIRNGDHISRLGGDEYLLGLMMDKESLNEVEGMTAKFIDLVSQPMNIEGLRIRIGASVGIAAYPIHGNNVDVLLDIADKRMYHVKKGKENKPYFEELTQLSNKKAKEPVVIFPGKSQQI